MFLKDKPTIGIQSGQPLVYPQDAPIYGSGGTHESVQRFYVPAGETLAGFVLKAYVDVVGSMPHPLTATIYADNNESITNGRPVYGEPLETETVSGISSAASWVSTTFTSTLIGGDYYWVKFTTSSGGDGVSNYYDVWEHQQTVFPDIYTLDGGQTSPVLWLTTKGGTTVTVYPYMTQGTNLRLTGTSTPLAPVTRATKVNFVSFYMSDRSYDPNNYTLSLETAGGSVLATGTFCLLCQHGVGSLTYMPIRAFDHRHAPAGDCLPGWFSATCRAATAMGPHCVAASLRMPSPRRSTPPPLGTMGRPPIP